MSSERTDEVDVAEGSPLTAPVRKLGLAPGQVVIEYGDDDDVDEDLREVVEAVVGSPMEDDSYDGVVDVVLLWWRDGDGDLADDLMDALTTMEEGGFILLLTPGSGRDDRVPAHELQEACTTCSLTASGGVALGEWVGQRLVGRR